MRLKILDKRDFKVDFVDCEEYARELNEENPGDDFTVLDIYRFFKKCKYIKIIEVIGNSKRKVI